MSTEAWLFLFAFIQTVCSVFAGLQFFGITPNNLAVPMNSKKWLAVMLFLWLGGLGFTGYGLYQLRDKNNEIASLQGAEVSKPSQEIAQPKLNKPDGDKTATNDRPREQPLVRITGKTFVNEKVLLDGFSYFNCFFDNVTFIYNGGRTEFASKINTSSPVRFETTNPTVKTLITIFYTLGLFDPNRFVPDPGAVP